MFIHQKSSTNGCADSCMLRCPYAILQEVVPTCESVFGVSAAINTTSNISSTANTTANSSCPSSFVLKANASTILNPNWTNCCVSHISAAASSAPQPQPMMAAKQCLYLLINKAECQPLRLWMSTHSPGCSPPHCGGICCVGEQLLSSCQVTAISKAQHLMLLTFTIFNTTAAQTAWYSLTAGASCSPHLRKLGTEW